jgi:putative endonuclease
MTTPRRQTGDLGERLAERFLRRLGHTLLARNYRCRDGEIDLITLDPADGCLCFIEVKTGPSDTPERPEERVDRRKRARLTAAARDYLRRKRAFDRPARFDVIAVLDPEAETPQIRHWPNAFTP